MDVANQRSQSKEISSFSSLVNTPSLVNAPHESSHRTTEAHRFIETELQHNERMPKDRQNVLKSALDFVSQISNSSLASQPMPNIPDTGMDLPSGSTAPELLYMMLPSKH